MWGEKHQPVKTLVKSDVIHDPEDISTGKTSAATALSIYLLLAVICIPAEYTAWLSMETDVFSSQMLYLYQQGQTQPNVLAEKPSASFEETPAFD